MTCCGVSHRVARALAAALLAGLVFSANAAAQVTDGDAKRLVEESYDVEVLRVREGDRVIIRMLMSSESFHLKRRLLNIFILDLEGV